MYALAPSRPEHELRRRLLRTIDRHADPLWRDDLRRCMPRVIDLIDEAHDRPADEYTPGIRAILRDQCLAGAGGASRFGDEPRFERHVALLVRVLEKFRDAQLRRGAWSAAPVPPQMFG